MLCSSSSENLPLNHIALVHTNTNVHAQAETEGAYLTADPQAKKKTKKREGSREEDKVPVGRARYLDLTAN